MNLFIKGLLCFGLSATLAACTDRQSTNKPSTPSEITMSNIHHTINYVELQATDLKAMKEFYGDAFGWTFQDWGEEYISFNGAGLEGGVAKYDTQPSRDGTLVILYSEELEKSQSAIKKAGGTITQAIYSFPGGRRFHFLDPGGNRLAIWSNRDENGNAIIVE
ncbi:MAG: VOC family protein [Pseudomonadota bacterium]